MCTVCVYIYMIVLNCFILYRILYHIIHGFQTRSHSKKLGVAPWPSPSPALRPWFSVRAATNIGSCFVHILPKATVAEDVDAWAHHLSVRSAPAFRRMNKKGEAAGPQVPNSKYRHMESDGIHRITDIIAAYYSCISHITLWPSLNSGNQLRKAKSCPRHHRMPCNQLANGTNEPQTDDRARRSAVNPSVFGSGHVQNIPGMGSANWFKGQHIHISYHYIPRGNKKNRNT